MAGFVTGMFLGAGLFAVGSWVANEYKKSKKKKK